jgi:hypothetical protein
MDDNPRTEDNTGILDRYKPLVELFERTVCVLLSDPAIYTAFKGREEAKIMKCFMQLPYDVRA